MAPDALERVSDRVYRVKDRYVNLYVIDAERIVLADTGTRTAEPKIRAGLRELGKEVSDVGLVLLTHHHGDHMGTAGGWALANGSDIQHLTAAGLGRSLGALGVDVAEETQAANSR